MVGRALLGMLLGGALLGAPGCGGKGKAKEPFPKPILARFEKAKLKVGEWKAVEKADVYGAARCHAGTVGEVSVLLCEYDSAEKAEAASEKRLSFVGTAVTAAQRLDGKVALVVADPDKKDLRGVTIQAVLQAFKETKPF